MKCPKCMASCTAITVEPQTWPPDPFKGPVLLYDHEYETLYECETHGEFGVNSDGTVEFGQPDCWVTGPNGEKLFRL